MTDKFNGFSQDDINKITGVKQIKRNPNDAVKQVLRNHPGIRRMPDKADQLRKQAQAPAPAAVASNGKTKSVSSSSSTPTPTTINVAANNKGNDVNKEEESLDLGQGQRPTLTDSLVQALYHGPINPNSQIQRGGIQSSESETTVDGSILHVNSNVTENDDDDASILPSSKAAQDEPINTDSPFRGISLKDFEKHRKMIEEQNKQKKQMLYQAIEQHSQKTAAESRKIEEIRHELSKLENDLAVDVAMLRKQIDTACIHFANVEKQYIKIEAQFLKAKLDLHNASEKKELLTEHLCTVIAHNEDRKANKLSELMQKVGLAPTDEPIVIPE